MLIAAVVVLALLLFLIVAMYNGLVSLKVQCDNAWSDIDVQFKRRYDLIPNLVETVKGYAAHEKGTLEGVVAARNRAMSSELAPSSSKKSASAEIRSTPSIAASVSASTDSVPAAGAWYAPRVA